MNSVNGKVVWITGASSGIGEALTYALNKKDCKLIISARKEDILQEVKNNCHKPENIKVLKLDIRNYESIKTITDKAVSLFGHIDILINNAGISQRSLIIDTDFKVYKKLVDINYLGTVALTKAMLPFFIIQNQGILN